MKARWLVVVALALLVLPALAFAAPGVQTAGAQEKPDTIKLDYAYYNPSSLVAADASAGWRRTLKADGDRASSGSSAPAATRPTSTCAPTRSTSARPPARRRCWPAPTARRSRPSTSTPSRSGRRWSCRQDSPITAVEQLKGKKIAATKGTDPYFFLLRSLNAGRALRQPTSRSSTCSTPTARPPWSGATSTPGPGSTRSWPRPSSKPGSKLLYRNIDFNTYGFLNARQEFVEQYPDLRDRAC